MAIIGIIGILLCMTAIWYLSPYSGKEETKQTTFIYCKCGNEMYSDDSFISDTYDENGDNHVRYKCQKCGRESDFNFDIAPVPINWEELNKCQSE